MTYLPRGRRAGFHRWIVVFSETGAGCYFVSALKKPTLGIFYTHDILIGIYRVQPPFKRMVFLYP